MVRGLLIRRIFIWLDVLLVVLMLLTIGMIAKSILLGSTPQNNQALLIDGDSMIASTNLNQVQDRSTYDIIIKSGLFGDSGDFDPDVAPVEDVVEPPGPDIVETDLNLRLIGTTATAPTDRFASAIIEDKDQRNAVGSYRIGDAIVDDVHLEEVYARYVIILNERKSPPSKETLSMDDEEKTETAMAQNSGRNKNSPPPQAVDNSPETMTVNRQELLQEVYMNYADLVGKVRPRMVRDESGQIAGVTADNIGDIPIAKQLGISNGDVLQSVNNERIDSEQKIMEMVQKYRNSPSIRVGIMRNGKPKTITYRLE